MSAFGWGLIRLPSQAHGIISPWQIKSQISGQRWDFSTFLKMLEQIIGQCGGFGWVTSDPIVQQGQYWGWCCILKLNNLIICSNMARGCTPLMTSIPCDLTWPRQFFLPEHAQRMSHKMLKNSAGSAKRFSFYLWKTSWGGRVVTTSQSWPGEG